MLLERPHLSTTCVELHPGPLLRPPPRLDLDRLGRAHMLGRTRKAKAIEANSRDAALGAAGLAASKARFRFRRGADRAAGVANCERLCGRRSEGRSLDAGQGIGADPDRAPDGRGLVCRSIEMPWD